MSDITHPGTGEVVSATGSDFAVRQADKLREFRPTNPVEMEFFIREANGLLEKMPDVLLEINNRRYEAERAYGKQKATRLAAYGSDGVQVTFARALAEVDALPQLEAWHNVKAEYHYAAATERALRTKVMSMLNVNRSVAVQYGASR